MTESVDVWSRRDLPVLIEITRRFDRGRDTLAAHQLVDATGLPEDDIERAIQNLGRGGYIVLDESWNPIVNDITERALLAAKLWPTPQTALDRMIAALEHIADNTDDDDTRTWARKMIDGLKRGSGQVGLSLVTAVLTGQIT